MTNKQYRRKFMKTCIHGFFIGILFGLILVEPANADGFYRIMLVETIPDADRGSIAKPVDSSFQSMSECKLAQIDFREREKIRVLLHNLWVSPWDRIVENGSFCCTLATQRNSTCNTVSKLARQNK